MTYREFKKHNDTSKLCKDIPIGRVTDVNLISETCRLTVESHSSVIPIAQLVEDIVYNEMGVISNPSILQRWRGFER